MLGQNPFPSGPGKRLERSYGDHRSRAAQRLYASVQQTLYVAVVLACHAGARDHSSADAIAGSTVSRCETMEAGPNGRIASLRDAPPDR
jgi:hypothetical protein